MRNCHRLWLNRGLWVLPAGIAMLLLGAAGAVANASQENPPARELPAATRAPSPPPSAAPSPPPAPSNPGGRAPSSPSPGHRGGGGGRSGGYYHGGHHYGHGYGFYGYGYHWPFSRFYWDYHRPYYPWGLVWYPAYSSDTRLGALDLSVKPWRTEVYVDGQYVGRAGKFDGYPGYLWLTEGSHQLVFHREGWQTVARRVSVRGGPIRGLKITLAEGPSTPPEGLFEPPPRTAKARERPSAPRAVAPEPRAGQRTEREAAVDVRDAPGRFRLEIAPADAAVYLDGRFLGNAEELSRLHAGMLVEAGEHFIEVQRPGYQAERVSFSVVAGDETEVKVDLSSSDGPTE